jgi:hypothetical protein
MPTLDWIGKQAVLNHHNEVPFHLLRCNPELSVGENGDGNLLVQGDILPEVKTWVRNLERRPNHSFWLQTSTDRFYPDFVCLLNDGRYLVIEYKGEDRWSNDDSREKRIIGEVWNRRSEGLRQGQRRCMATPGWPIGNTLPRTKPGHFYASYE